MCDRHENRRARTHSFSISVRQRTDGPVIDSYPAHRGGEVEAARTAEHHRFARQGVSAVRTIHCDLTDPGDATPVVWHVACGRSEKL